MRSASACLPLERRSTDALQGIYVKYTSRPRYDRSSALCARRSTRTRLWQEAASKCGTCSLTRRGSSTHASISTNTRSNPFQSIYMCPHKPLLQTSVAEHSGNALSIAFRACAKNCKWGILSQSLDGSGGACIKLSRGTFGICFVAQKMCCRPSVATTTAMTSMHASKLIAASVKCLFVTIAFLASPATCPASLWFSPTITS